MRQRKNVDYLSSNELERYRAAVSKLQANGKYDGLVRFHSVYCAGVHGTLYFLPWHRQLLLAFEDALCDASGLEMGVPYWDWWHPLNPGEVPGAFAEGKDCSNEPNPLAPCGIGRFSPQFRLDHKYKFPVETEWNTALSTAKTWADFGGTEDDGGGVLEARHNCVHRWVGTAMGDSSTAVADPIFWSHHSFVDLLWASEQGKPGRDPETDLNDSLEGFDRKKVRDVLSISALHYEYVVASQHSHVDLVPERGCAFARFSGVLPRPNSYSSVRLRLRSQFSMDVTSLQVSWGQDPASILEARQPDGGGFDSFTCLFGMRQMAGGEQMSSTQTFWVPGAQFERLDERHRGNLPICIFALGTDNRPYNRTLSPITAELAFMP